MNQLSSRRVNFFLELAYPMEVVARSDGYHARLPDLPGCEVLTTDLDQAKVHISRLREEWLLEQLEAGKTPPLPNSFLGVEAVAAS